MKLKLIAAAIGLIVSAGSQAASIVPPTAATGSDMLLSVWEQGVSGVPDQSFTIDTGMTMSAFLASPTSLSLTLLSSDTTWTNFLATSNDAALQWALLGSGKVTSPNVPVDGAGKQPSIISTITVGNEALAAQQQTATIGAANTQNSTFINNLNILSNPTESVNQTGTNQYFQTLQLSSWNQQAWNNSNLIGTSAAIEQATNSKFSTDIGYINVLPGTVNFAQSGSNYVLNYTVAAVPEAPGFAMLLAGFGLMGFVALRRKNA